MAEATLALPQTDSESPSNLSDDAAATVSPETAAAGAVEGEGGEQDQPDAVEEARIKAEVDRRLEEERRKDQSERDKRENFNRVKAEYDGRVKTHKLLLPDAHKKIKQLVSEDRDLSELELKGLDTTIHGILDPIHENAIVAIHELYRDRFRNDLLSYFPNDTTLAEASMTFSPDEIVGRLISAARALGIEEGKKAGLGPDEVKVTKKEWESRQKAGDLEQKAQAGDRVAPSRPARPASTQTDAEKLLDPNTPISELEAILKRQGM